MTRLLADIKQAMSDMDAETFSCAELLVKKVHAAQHVCRTYKSHGANSKALLATYLEMTKFLEAAPVAENPFPAFLRAEMHHTEAQDAWPAERFWSLVSAPSFHATGLQEQERQTTMYRCARFPLACVP